MDFSRITTTQKVDLLVSFMDIQNFLSIAQSFEDSIKVFDFLNDFARIVQECMENTEGRLIKFIGDSCLIVFPEDSVDQGVTAIREIKRRFEAHMRELGLQNKLRVTAHFGETAIGMMGIGDSRRLDVIGDSVNIAAMLGRGEHRGRLIISPQAFRKLSPATRKLFHKYTPPIVYVAEE